LGHSVLLLFASIAMAHNDVTLKPVQPKRKIKLEWHLVRAQSARNCMRRFTFHKVV